jgi:two-component system, LytTR family, response regulator LytT
MNVLIVEDEIHTAKGLVRMLQSIDREVVVQKIVGSIEETVEYLAESPSIDLIFMDIQLSDGICFEIFSGIEVEYPVIFTTSYDEYAIKAFQVNSVDYLLKPIEQDALHKSLDKFKKHFSLNTQKVQVEQFLKQITFTQREYRSRILLKNAQGLLSLSVSDIAYFYIDTQLVFAKLFNDSYCATDKTLDELENSLDPKKFFRLNRQFITSVKSIHSISNYFNNTLKVTLKPAIDKEIIVSRYSVKEFKEWLDA